MLGDDKKLQVTLNVFKNLNNGGSFDEQKLNEELKELEERMHKKVNYPFLQELKVKSKYYQVIRSFNIKIICCLLFRA